jgi:phosphate uptake regulator
MKPGNMEIRKVQVTGGSSFVITLPKEWIKSLGIKKNDPLGLVVQQDGTLVVTAKTTPEQLHRKKTFNADSVDDPVYLFRLLVGAYMMGYTTIEIVSKERIEPEIREAVIGFTQTAIGPEIIEESAKSITIKDLLSPTEMPFDKTVRRMQILVRTMHEDAIKALRAGDLALARAVVERDRELDRLHWLVARQSNVVLRDMTLSKKMAVTQEEATYYFLISRFVERIGDHAVRIANNVDQLSGAKVDPRVLEEIYTVSQASLTLLKNSIDAWFKKDLAAANDNITAVKSIARSCEDIAHKAMKAKGPSAVPISYIAESLRRTAELSADISELAINNLVKD